MDDARLLHDIYLPFTKDQLKEHFARVTGGGDVEAKVRYYVEGARRPPAHPLARQIEKDERFWVVAALMGLYHRENRVKALSELLTRGFGAVPPVPVFASWDQALEGDVKLYFEANLPSPTSYRRDLAHRFEEHLLTPPAVEGAARRVAAGKPLEGATKADAILVAPDTGFAVVFEAKVLSDLSTSITFDVTRNQLARTIDVLLDRSSGVDQSLQARVPERTLVALLTPEIFRRNPTTRLYGYLVRDYRENPQRLAQHLPHRPMSTNWEGVAKRLGWLTWEDVNRVRPGTCRWLPVTGPRTAAGVSEGLTAA